MRYVVAVADELHFSRAAEKLRVAQPALSRQIRGLEEYLDTKLFVRTTRELHLTEAGRAFVEEAKEALLHSERAVHRAKASRHPETFTLGHSPEINPGLLPKLCTMPAQLWKLSLRSAFTMEQLQLLRTGELDAGIVTLPVPDKSMTIVPVISEPLMVALPESNDLCESKSLLLRDLNGVPLVSIPRRAHPHFYDRVHSICVREGFHPTIVQEVTGFPEAMALVADGVGFAFTRECYERFKCPGVVFQKIEGQPLVIESAIAFRKGMRSSVLPSLIEALQAKKRPAPVFAYRGKAAG